MEITTRTAPPAPPPGQVTVAWINHSTFFLRTPEMTALFDPVYSTRCGPFGQMGPRRVHAPGIRFEDLPPIDVVFLSHDHYDHCDLHTLRRLSARDRPRAITPLGNGELLRRAHFREIVELDWWQRHTLSASTRVTLTPAQHWSNRITGPRMGRLWGGFHLQTEGKRLQFVGDTGYHPTWFQEIATRLGAPNLALVPIGAYEPRWFMKGQHCNPSEAVQIHRDLSAKISVAMHWGTFQLTDEAREAPPTALRAALSLAGISEADFRILEPGQALSV